MALDGNFLLDAKDGLVEVEFKVLAQIGAALCPAAATATAEHVAHAEEAAENVAEIGEVLEDGGIEARSATDTTDPGVSIAIVGSALLRISEDGIGLGDLLEFFLGDGGIARIAIRVVLECQLAIGALDLLIGRGAGDTQDFVVIAFTVAAQSTFLGR